MRWLLRALIFSGLAASPLVQGSEEWTPQGDSPEPSVVPAPGASLVTLPTDDEFVTLIVEQPPVAATPAEPAPAQPAPAAPVAAAAPAPAPLPPTPAALERQAAADALRQAGYGLFEGYADRDPPKVKSRKERLTFYPCATCHGVIPTNPTPRAVLLHAPIGLVDGILDHGQQRFWCLTCHNPDDRNSLQTLAGVKVDFNEAWKVCGQCHSARQKDWYFGAHGKRVDNWHGDAERYNCTECHNPHRPPFRQQKPQPAPPVRVGLEPMPKVGASHFARVWERHADKALPVEVKK